MKRNFLSVSMTLLLGVLPSSLVQAAGSNQELKIGISQEFENMNPVIMTMLASTYLSKLVGRTLVNLDADVKWYTQLAKSIPTFENGGAKFITVNGVKTIQAVWEIKDNAKWGDGTPLTCEDFDFTLKVAGSPNVSVGEKETYTQVAKVEWDKATPKKCTFIYDQARWDFNRLAGLTPLPKHLEAPIFEKYEKQKEGYEKNSNYVKNPTNPGLYNGPYVISEVKLGSHVIFVPNKHFYGTAPVIQKIVVKIIPNTGTLEANLRSGEIDMISTLGLTFDQGLAFEKKVKAENLPYNVIFKSGITYEHIDFNLENPILKDKKVRAALIHGVNREDLTKALFEGKQEPAIHFLSPIDPWYTKDPKFFVNYRYSQRDAAKLLDEAGWKVGSDSYRFKDGKKLSFSISSTAGNKTRELVEQYLKDQWKKIGVDLEIKNEPARVFFGETTRKRKFPGLAMYAWISSPESSPKSTLHSQKIPNEKNGWSGQNTTGWINKGVDESIEKLDIEFSAEKRLNYIHQVVKSYTEDAPVLPLYYRSDVAVAPKNIKNFRLTGHQFSETNEAETWTY
jgi:peptide/nickel transport system substrate-binding protein